MRRARVPCLLALGAFLSSSACASKAPSATCSTTATCEALAARTLHHDVLLPAGERIVTGGLDGAGTLSIVFDRFPTDPEGFNATTSKANKSQTCTTILRAASGRSFCFAREDNGIDVSFEDSDLRYLIVSTDQPGHRPLGKDDASALVALYG